jgi:hypothetical protein
MSIKARKQPDALTNALISASNQTARAYVAGSTTYPHVDVTSTTGGNYQAPTTSPLLVTGTAVDLSSTITVAEQIRTVLFTHFNDAGAATNLYGGAHKAADTTNATPISYATIAKILPATGTLSQVEALLNALKTACLAHVSQSGVHFTNDGTNTVSAANATDLTSSETLASGSGGLKAFVNAHIQFASAAVTVTPIPA